MTASVRVVRLLGTALLVALSLTAACARGAAARRDARENAFRANNVGVALLEQFQYVEAAAAFRRASTIDASLAPPHLNLALALFYSQDLVAAAREAREAERLQPDAPQAPYVEALIARADNRPADARRFLERVREIDPHDSATNTLLGQLLMQEERYADAAAALRLAVADEPYNVTAVYALGQALVRSGNAAEGRTLVERSQALRATGYGVAFGNGYLEQGRYAEAIASTGLEPELIDERTPGVRFVPTPISERQAGVGLGSDSDRASPFGRRFAAGELAPSAASAIAAGLGGCLTLLDFDGDGDLDVMVAARGAESLFRNDGGRWTDVTVAAGLGAVPPGAVPIGCLAADYDNDGRTDLFVLRAGGSSLYRNDGNGRFTDVTAAAHVPAYPFLPGAAAFVDVDHDGDLDLVVAGLADLDATRDRAGSRALVFPRDFEPAPLQLLRNNGDGTFTDITAAARLDVRTHAVALAPTDFDNRRDVDLLVVSRDGPPLLFKNLRDGTFRDVAADVGLAGVAIAGDEIAAAAVADLNKDDFPDVAFARARGGALALSNGRAGFTVVPAPDRGPATAVQFFDYDNDGLLDILSWDGNGPHLFRNLGKRWDDVTARAFGVEAPRSRGTLSSRALAIADIDGDGRPDIVVSDGGGVTLWRNVADSTPRASHLRVTLKGVVSNRSAVGAKVQLRAGSLSARLETSAATPAVAPYDLVFGLGERRAADAVRVLWPSGTLQAEVAADAGRPLSITELNRKPSSCPFLFSWNGTRFEFVTDFLGGGEMGYWEGPGRRNRPDPVEYVRIADGQLRPKDGRFELRVTNELEEALFLDRLQLVAIAHPPDVDVFPDEGMTDPPKPDRIVTVADQRAPVKVTDDHGHDQTDRIARIDRVYPDDFDVLPFRGYAVPHALTIDLGDVSHDRGATLLLLTGWTDYAFSSDNVAAQQAGLALAPPSLQIRGVDGAWRTAIADIGIPVGRPQTIVADVSGKLRPGEHEVRIATNMRIYWDRILVARAATGSAIQMRPIDPRAARLGRRGFSSEVRPDGREPATYDYGRVTPTAEWKVMPGAYTREGDVRALIAASDDMYAITAPGDEITVSFDADSAGQLPRGWRRTFILVADGFSKEMDINSASPDALEPLPFHGMTRYPYGAGERYPWDPLHDAYRSRYNTRRLPKPLPFLAGVK
jgi:tetratricopeptide (TPR) repeat protein